MTSPGRPLPPREGSWPGRRGSGWVAPFLLAALLLAPWSGMPGRVQAARTAAASPAAQAAEAAQAAQAAPSPGAAAALALARINVYRGLAGLPPLRLDPELGRAAQAHADYFLQNLADFRQITLAVHREEPGRPGFTGVEPWDRAAAQGYPSRSSIGEDMAFGTGVLEGVDGLMATVYHRFLLLDPYAADAGVGLAGRRGEAAALPVLDLETGRRGDWPRLDPATAVLYPADGQSGVPVAFDGEVPDPLAAFGARPPTGYPITVQFPSLLLSSLELRSASLVDLGSGAAVPFWALTPAEAASAGQKEELGQAVALLPKAPLRPGVRYQVALDLVLRDVSGREVRLHRTWSFTTQARAYPALSRVDARWSLDGRGRVGRVELSLPAGIPGSAVRAFLAGLPVAREAAGGSTCAFRAPAGVTAGPADLLVELDDGQGLVWPDFLGAGEPVAPAAGTPPVRAALSVDGRPAGSAQRLAGGLLRLPLDVVAAFGGWRLRALPGTGERWLEPSQGGAGYLAVAGRALLWPVGRAVLPEPLPAPVVGEGETVWMPLQPGSAPARELLGPSARLVVRGDGSVALNHLLYDTRSHWAGPLIEELARRGVVAGYPDGSFRPDRPVSRGEALALLVRALGLKPVPHPGESWVAQAGFLGAALQEGLLTARDAAAFEPSAPLDRLQLAVWLARTRALARWRPAPATALPYADLAGLSAEERQAVAVVRAAGVMLGEPGAPAPRFAPARPLSRAEAAAVASRLPAPAGH
ncbi:MAG: S-layer homology domain-containing protein [Bacillota bacterium]|nr:S-layer homology domain-containing protein [Bacillota bacterium]